MGGYKLGQAYRRDSPVSVSDGDRKPKGGKEKATEQRCWPKPLREYIPRVWVWDIDPHPSATDTDGCLVRAEPMFGVVSDTDMLVLFVSIYVFMS